MATILIVDDDPPSREFLVTLLGYSGHRLLEAADGVEALEQVRAEHLDLIISDILMPTMDGYELVRRLRAEPSSAQIPVIFNTANYRLREAQKLAQACGVSIILPKPCEPERVLSIVNEVLGPPQLPLPPPPGLAKGADSEPIARVSDHGADLQELQASLTDLQAVSLRLAALLKFSLKLAAEHRPLPLLELFCRGAQHILSARYAGLGILDADGQRLRYFLIKGMDAETQARLGTPLPRSGMLGELLANRRPQRLYPLKGNPQAVGLPASHPPIDSFLGVPIASPTQAYGWLYLTNKLGVSEFSEDDERLAITLAAQLAVAYENTRLYANIQRRTVQLEQEMAERVQAEAALRESEERARATFEQAAVGIAQVAPTGQWLRVNQRLCAIVGYSREELLQRTFQDITHPDDLEADLKRLRQLLANEIQTYATEKRYLRKDGASVWVNLTVSLVRDSAGQPKYLIAVVEDITERKHYAEQLAYQANYDALTGLPNRSLLADRLKQAIAHSLRTGRPMALLLLDLDRFKVINDSLGHGTGDALLKEMAQRLTTSLRKEDTVARLGGDEFVILITEVARIADIAHVAEKLLDKLSMPMCLLKQELFMTGSIGISLYPQDGEHEETLLKNADTAMYAAKRRGCNGFQFYTREMNARARESLKMEAHLRRAVERGELVLHYQPRVELASGQVVGVEALLRWHRPESGMVSPAEFIPLAEETGLILPLGEWVLQAACRQASAWVEQGLPAISVAVNLSARQFHSQNLANLCQRALREAGLEPGYLDLELTESAVMQNVEEAIATLQELKAIGLRLAMDDFGTGYSSLSYLKRLPIDSLKIDQSFVRNITTDPDDAAIAVTVIAMAHTLKLRVIAEGVETKQQLDFLRAYGCHEAQGYYLSRPLPATEVTSLLRKNGLLPLQ